MNLELKPESGQPNSQTRTTVDRDGSSKCCPQATSNMLCSTRPPVLSVFAAILRQFRHFSNVYFLVVAMLAFVRHLSPNEPVTGLFGFVIVLMPSIVREVLEERWRRQAECRVNAQKCSLVCDSGLKSVEWQSLALGDTVELQDGELCPADVLITGCGSSGSCYIQTTSLDGETSLKGRYAVTGPISRLVTGKPRADLDIFECRLFVAEEDASGSPLNVNTFIPREAIVRLPDAGSVCRGLVVYVGKDTKIAIGGSGLVSSKISKIDRLCSLAVLVVVMAQLSLCIFAATASLDRHKSPLTAFENFLSCFLLLQLMIPLSLIASLECVRVMQSQLMVRDVFLKGLRVKCTGIIDDLGQIGYVLSDKTGTLTSNKLELREIVSIDERKLVLPPVHCNESVLASASTESLVYLLCNLALNHTATPKGWIDVASEKTLSYCADSPDEVALLNGLRQIGLFVTSRSSTSITVCVDSAKVPDSVGSVIGGVWEILATYKFDNARKRSSIIVRKLVGHQSDVSEKTVSDSVGMRTSVGEHFPVGSTSSDVPIFIFTKGADDAVMSVSSETPKEVVDILASRVLAYAKTGLRTLCFSCRRLTATELRGLDLEDCATVEAQMSLLGATATEDKLAPHVPETIRLLREAGIKVWMITGDKQETAVEISKTSGVFSASQEIVFFEDLVKLKAARAADTTSNRTDGESDSWSKERLEKVGVAVSGRLVDDMYLQKDYEQLNFFKSVAMSAGSIVVFRAAKEVKAKLVRLVMDAERSRKLVLAIGDGANDVEMIKAADVGIGVTGKEGREAANAADFAVLRFADLERLLLYHGRANCVRTSKVTLYCLAKNILLSICMYAYSGAVGHFSSPQSVPRYFSLGFNTMFTIIPILTLGVLDSDASPTDVLADTQGIYATDLASCYPRLYGTSLFSKYFQPKVIGMTVCTCVLIALLFCSPLLAGVFSHTAFSADGFVAGVEPYECYAYLCVFLFVTLLVFVIAESINVVLICGIAYSIFLVLSLLLGTIWGIPEGFFGPSAILLARSPAGYLTMLLAVATPLLAILAFFQYKARFHPYATSFWKVARDAAARVKGPARIMFDHGCEKDSDCELVQPLCDGEALPVGDLPRGVSVEKDAAVPEPRSAAAAFRRLTFSAQNRASLSDEERSLSKP